MDYPEIVHIVRCQLNSKVSPPVVNCHTEVKPNKPMRLSVVFSMSNGEDLSGYKLLIFLKYNGKCVCTCSVKMNKLNHEIADIRSGRKKTYNQKQGGKLGYILLSREKNQGRIVNLLTLESIHPD